MKIWGAFKLSFLNRALSLKILVYAVIVIFISNINALVDAFAHPEIPYFDHEHIIVGAFIGLFSAIVGLIILYYLNRLQNSNKEKERLIDNLYDAKLKAEESDRLKTAFLANISHEIRTPMSGIISFANLLQKSDLSPKQQKVSLEMIQASGERMLNLINDLLDISRIESGIINVRWSLIKINEQLDYIQNLFETEAAKKGVKLIVKKPLSDEDAVCHTDCEKFISIWTNLVKNALKFTDSGEIVFGYEPGEMSDGTNKEGMLSFFVKDTGIGIPEERQKAIFDRFVQADIEDEQAREGVGLGLSIARAYIEMLGGKIWVESNKGKGSTFWFQIPNKNPYAPENIEKQAIGEDDLLRKKLNIDGLHVLIVEDEVTSENYLTAILSNVADKIYLAQNGEEAVEYCRNNPQINLILMDIRMPVMNGYEATRLIRKFNQNVVVVAQTAYTFTEDEKKALDAGCNYYLMKPIAKQDLLNLIQDAFGK